MKIYYSYDQLNTPEGEDKRKLFQSNFLTAFKTGYSVIGIIFMISIPLVGNQIFSSNLWLVKIISSVLSAGIFFHFHCMGIQKLINQKS